MIRFINDFKKYWKYSSYAAKSGLKSEVAGSKLSWIWWILEPFMFMLVYYFIATMVFSKSMDYAPAFIFLGLTMWNFFNKVISESVKIVSSNRAIVSKVYIPKYMLIITSMIQNAIKMLISFGILLGLMIVINVKFTFQMIYIVPILITYFVLVFGISCILAHFGVFIEDLKNIVNILFRVMFYLSGIFYDITAKGVMNTAHTILGIEIIPGNLLLRLNPTACLIQEGRSVFIYGTGLHFGYLAIWFVIGAIISVIGVSTIYKNENSYVKVI